MNTNEYKKVNNDRDLRMVWIKCKKCKDIIHSTYPDELVNCKCGRCYIQGNEDYTRIGGDDSNWTRLTKKQIEEEIKKNVQC